MTQSNAARRGALWLGLAAALILTGWGAEARAQMDFSLDEAETESDAPAEGGGDGADMTFDESGEVVEDNTGGGEGGDDLLDALADDSGPEERRERVERPTETVEEIVAVQRIYALRLNRVEIAPGAAFTTNDPFQSHPSLTLAVNYWWTNVLAVGANFLFYQFGDTTRRESDLNFFVRRSARLGIPINEWQLASYLNFTYVPFYGKFAAFNKFIFQYDAYIVGGVGVARTRPIPVIDPEFRSFDFENRVAFNIGLGIRLFVTRYLGVFVEFRDYAWLERFESLEVAPTPDQRADPDTWLDDSPTFVNNATINFGITMFFPFNFEYRLPK